MTEVNKIKGISLLKMMIMFLICIPISYLLARFIAIDIFNIGQPFLGILFTVFLYVSLLIICLREIKRNHISMKHLINASAQVKLPEFAFLFVLMKIIVSSMMAAAMLFFVYTHIPFDDGDSIGANISDSSTVFLINTIIVVILAPITEEIFFRGILLQKLALKWGLYKGIFVSSLLFALLHLDTLPINTFMGGIILSIIFIRYKSLMASILFHSLYNFFNQVTKLQFMDDTADQPSVEVFKITGWYGLIIFILSFSFFIYYLRKRRLKNVLPIV